MARKRQIKALRTPESMFDVVEQLKLVLEDLWGFTADINQHGFGTFRLFWNGNEDVPPSLAHLVISIEDEDEYDARVEEMAAAGIDVD